MTSSNTRPSSSGCFSLIIRRLLCNGTPQTHPSDHVLAQEPNMKTEFCVKHDQVEVININPAHTPGVVARLMGLDSLPESNLKPKTPDLVSRSRSVNFMEYLLEFDLTPSSRQHRRVRTSVSFREVPPLPTLSKFQPSQDFLVEEISLKLKKADLNFDASKDFIFPTSNFAEVKQKIRPEKNKKKESKRDPVKENRNYNNDKKKKKISNKFKDETRKVSRKHDSKVNKNRAPKVSSLVSSPPRRRKEDANRKSRATTSKKLEPVDCSSSETSSPVSVLESLEFDLHEVIPPSEDVDTKKKSSPKAKILENPSTHYTNILNSDDIFQSRAINKSVEESTRTEYFEELVAKLIESTGDDIKQTDWMNSRGTVADVGEVCTEVERQLLDLMLKQVVDELMWTCHV